MKKTTTLKALALSAIMILGLALPMMAQSDGFFRTADDYTNRAESSWYLINQTFGEDPGSIVNGGINTQQFGSTPLGSGLLIMVAAGAGYVVVRRKRARKGVTLLLAAAMLLGMTQCKKKAETLVQQQGKLITVRIANDSKHHVITSGDPWPTGDLGKIEWEDEDFLFVLSGGLPVGLLEYDEDIQAFQGVIGPGNEMDAPFSPVDGQPLYFCFTGNRLPGSWEDMTIDISDQSDNLPVLSFGASEEDYPSATGDYTCFMENKCALVKFTLSTGTEDDIRISNMITKAELVFGVGNGEIKPTTTRGSMILHRVPGGPANERWAILLPQDAVQGVSVLARNVAYQGAADVPKVNVNDLKYVTLDLAGATVVNVQPYFSVGGGRIVNFAPGNLQYQANSTSATEPPYTGVYRFAKHQWDYVGGKKSDDPDNNWGNVYEGGVQCDNDLISPSYTGWIDLFGWGTGNNPTKTVLDPTQYYTFYDWGNYVNDDDYTWFTLGQREYEYLINNKEYHAIRSLKIAPATVHGVGGCVILPDFFDLDPDDYSFNTLSTDQDMLNHMDDCTMNVYSNDDWALMEGAGAVFLPATGMRDGSYGYFNEDKNDHTNPGVEVWKTYWSRDDKGKNSSNAGMALYGRNAMWVNDFMRYDGIAVRLVHEVEF